MKSIIKGTAVTALACALTTGSATAAEILVNADIAVSTTWTSNNTYNLQDQIYVLPGATLTIEPGTVIASTTNLGGSLAVAKGAQINVLGSASAPVIMTSKADTNTWTGGNPATGAWREACNEWGNLTLMGGAYISEDATPGNAATPNANNVATMEGLTPDFVGDTKVLYGGGDDDYDAGTVQYLSIRYGGKVIALNNELNGLSLGGLGRGTDIHHVEIMNNVDDGIEIWGGTFNIKNFAIWNVGDDSFDVDQGWRGKAQFGLIVQGYSIDASQGSGVGDNACETDGAEDSDWQPVTTTSIYNMTIIGQPVDGDGLTAWRDNARVQYHNSIFMDCGEKVVRFDNIDGDGANGYGHNGTLSWADTWNTSYTVTSPVNAPGNPGAFYQAQSSGRLCEITDSVFFRNLNPDAYTEANARGVFNASNNNVLTPGFDDVDSPLTTLTRGPAVVRGGKTMLPVTFLDPTPANDAVASVGAAPNDGFYTPAMYRGAFHPTDDAWICGWTASEAFGFTNSGACNAGPSAYCDPAPATSVSAGGAVLTSTGGFGTASATFLVTGIPNQPGLLFGGPNQVQFPFGCGNVCVAGQLVRGLPRFPQNNTLIDTFDMSPANVVNVQYWFRDPANIPSCGGAWNLSNAVQP